MTQSPTPATAARPQRRTQDERRTATREKLILAAIHCIHTLGYAATTFATVAEAAGVSRGALTHHFPVKTDLVLALVRFVFDEDFKHYAATAARVEPQTWLRELPATMWGVISSPSGIAVTEIFLATRSDPELATRLNAIQQQINAESLAALRRMRAAAGIEAGPDDVAIHSIFVAAVRGLSLELLVTRNRDAAEQSIAILTRLLTLLYPQLAASR